MSDYLIQQLFEARLQSFADGEGVKTYHENESVDPAETDFLRITLLPAPASSDDLEGKHTAFTGVVQIDVGTAPGIGAGKARERGAALAQVFAMNLVMRDGGFQVQQVTPLQPGPGSTDRNHFVIPHRLRYRADTVG